MDTSACDITFDTRGRCNYCTEFMHRIESRETTDKIRRRDQFIEQVRESGRGKEYDCIVGVSGGIDSSYTLYLTKKHGLRPLAVHLDNGWNSELAVHNINNLVNCLGIDLYTHVIDWEENRDLQLSFFKANVIDIEMLMDNAMKALNYRMTDKYGLKYILAGSNVMTEGFRMPDGWGHFKYDVRNIRCIHRRYGSVPLQTHPLISTLGYIWYEFVRGVSWVAFLDFFCYRKADALGVLQREVDYKAYPYKHYESVFTRFYQGYILPRKFGIDKRRVHLSALIVSGQMTRDEALKDLQSEPYTDPKSLSKDRTFVMKKLGFSEESFADYLRQNPIPHRAYGSERIVWSTLMRLYRAVGPLVGSHR